MAFWNRRKSEYEGMIEIIEKNSGIRPAELARRLVVSRSTIQRRLPSLDDAGYLLYKDAKGGLYPFLRKGR